MAAKEEAVEKEKRIREVKIERKEEHPLGRTKIDGARDIDSYTHNIYTQNAHLNSYLCPSKMAWLAKQH